MPLVTVVDEKQDEGLLKGQTSLTQFGWFPKCASLQTKQNKEIRNNQLRFACNPAWSSARCIIQKQVLLIKF
jgi:hypothetical protein